MMCTVQVQNNDLHLELESMQTLPLTYSIKKLNVATPTNKNDSMFLMRNASHYFGLVQCTAALNHEATITAVPGKEVSMC